MRQAWFRRAALCVALLSGLAACDDDAKPAPSPAPPAQPEPAPATTKASSPPGTLLSSEPAPPSWQKLLPAGANATRVHYSSVSGVDGSQTEVSGVVLTPAGPAPEGGWRIITAGHGLTGTTGDCGPSVRPELTLTSKKIIPLVKAGYLVVMSDYQGLSSPGTHPFLDPKTAAHNLIDAVAATRQLVPQASNQWAVWGYSQGGHAAWATLEHAKEFGRGYKFVGAVALAPAADDAALFAAAQGGKLTKGQESVFVNLIEGYLAKHPEGKWEDFLSGVLLEHHETFTSCTPESAAELAKLLPQIVPADVVPASEEARAKLGQWLAEVSLPQGSGDGPLLVVYGEKDDLLLPEWVHAAVLKGCQMGLVAQEVPRPGQNHATIEDDQGVLDWLAGRFAGEPAPTSCF